MSQNSMTEIFLDVSSNDNCDLALMRVFQVSKLKGPITFVETNDLSGRSGLFEVVG